MALLLYAVLAVLVGNEVVAPPARAPARFALRAAPPQWRRRASWFRGPGPPPPLVRFAPSLLGPALFLFGGVVAPGLGVFRPCGGGDTGTGPQLLS